MQAARLQSEMATQMAQRQKHKLISRALASWHLLTTRTRARLQQAYQIVAHKQQRMLQAMFALWRREAQFVRRAALLIRRRGCLRDHQV